MINIEQKTFNKDFLAGNLKNLRNYCGFKTFEVAYFLNLSSSAYGYYESRRSTPPLDKLIKIAVRYDVTMKDLVRKPSELMAHLERERKLAEIKRELNLTEEQVFLLKSILND